MENNLNLVDLLEHVDPSILDYTEWVNVGMALKEEGYTASDWDNWSKSDGRYKLGETFRKWESFQGNSSPVTGATIVQLAKDQGYVFGYNRNDAHELDWDDTIQDELVVIDRNWIEKQEIKEPSQWNPAKEMITYLETLFESNEKVGYVTDYWQNDDGKYLPQKGNYDRTARQLIDELEKCDGDTGAVLGDYKEEAGAWIRFNPLDGLGVKNDNVTAFRYALVESDKMDLEQQNAILRELELPIALLVHSGKKSLHAIVKVDAANLDEYKKRVDYLYNVCKKNGLVIDTQNRNPSRLSRMPGIVRNGKKQFIIDKNIGQQTWEEWHEWIESVNDDLPDPESLTDTWDNMPVLAPVLIDGVLRQGHKMLMAGPSKAGKSFALIEMTIAIAEGREWLGWPCTKGKVLYVNLELDRSSCLHRFKDVYTALDWQPNGIGNIDIWNLRGKSVPMDKLAPKLIRRAAKKDYIAVIIDPIYKVLTGDENSADQMAHFTNQFDKVCTELGSSVIYCHHHSKGSQGSKKSMDRASGSGVFARDPDALIDLVELELNEDVKKQQENNMLCQVYEQALKQYNPDYLDTEISQDDLCSQVLMKEHIGRSLKQKNRLEVEEWGRQALAQLRNKSAWRVEGTLREFPKFEAKNMWFDYPRHELDTTGILKDVKLDDGFKAPWKKNGTKKKTAEERKVERLAALEVAYSAVSIGDEVTPDDLAEYLGISEKTARRHIKEHPHFYIDEGLVGKKAKGQTEK
ncbi:AAA family ATPase [Listeria monocytogenes]|uniref:AAA family ATPase n=2 Tax=Listeria monocytogenes TaxID=1639 RepID=UPI0011EB6BA9|nr:AAA family ATPase [Listeria monocytogenes]TYV04650.1 AAA family ATPase [Listeria monocytogenes]